MEGQSSISVEAFVARMRERSERMLREVAASVNAAADGRVIADSEYAVRDAVDAFKREAYQEALQMRSDAAEAAFSPSA